jgi:SAM-dependent methyltransferase
MEHIKTFFPHELIRRNATSKVIPHILLELRNAISDKSVLFLGFGDAILDFLDNGKLYYAIPKGYKITRWPKIRPFKTVVIDVDALPFAQNTFEVVIVNHYFEFFHKNSRFLQEIFRILKQNGKLLTTALSRRHSSDLPGKIRSIEDIVLDISEASFHISNVWGINKKARFLSYNFSYDQNKFSKISLGFFQLLASIIIITADKNEAALESVFSFKEKYEAV